MEIWNGSYFPVTAIGSSKDCEARISLINLTKNRLSPEYLNEGKNKAYYIYFLNMQDFRKEGFNNIRNIRLNTCRYFQKNSLSYEEVILFNSTYKILRDLKSKNAQKELNITGSNF